MTKEIGKVIHWFDKVNVAVVRLDASLKVGDTIKISKGENEIEETVSSMQVNHADVSSGEKGDEVAIKLSGKTKAGATVSVG